MTPEQSPRYAKSTEWLNRALKTIPLGSQTFSKSKVQYPVGQAPLFLQRGKGSQVWDIDGNQYTDFVCSLLSMLLGHQDPDVNSAVLAQIQEGTIFSLAHPIETLVAEKMVDMIPCAEMVRFGKNGSDATSGAIRLARAHTKRDRIAICGYHGWQDWYIGATARNLGVPGAVQKLSHNFAYNDLESLRKVLTSHPGEFAAVIMEPMNVFDPLPGFLNEVKELAHQHGALFILDEVITGFRYSRGGAQELFGVTPDLASFGKGMGNGYPIAAVVGRADIMTKMQDIFFSTTFGGETLSLAASLAVLNKIDKEPVLQKIAETGRSVMAGARAAISENKLEEVMDVKGHPSWSFLIFKDQPGVTQWEIKTLFLQEMLLRGLITFGSHNISYAHSPADVQKLIGAYREVFPMIADGVKNQNIKKHLRCAVIEPVFKVR